MDAITWNQTHAHQPIELNLPGWIVNTGRAIGNVARGTVQLAEYFTLGQLRFIFQELPQRVNETYDLARGSLATTTLDEVRREVYAEFLAQEDLSFKEKAVAMKNFAVMEGTSLANKVNMAANHAAFTMTPAAYQALNFAGFDLIAANALGVPQMIENAKGYFQSQSSSASASAYQQADNMCQALRTDHSIESSAFNSQFEVTDVNLYSEGGAQNYLGDSTQNQIKSAATYNLGVPFGEEFPDNDIAVLRHSNKVENLSLSTHQDFLQKAIDAHVGGEGSTAETIFKIDQPWWGSNGLYFVVNPEIGCDQTEILKRIQTVYGPEFLQTGWGGEDSLLLSNHLI